MSKRDPIFDVLDWQNAWDRRAMACRARQAGLKFSQIGAVFGISKPRARQLVETHYRKNGTISPLEDYLAADAASKAITDFLNIGTPRKIQSWRIEENARASATAGKNVGLREAEVIALRLRRALEVFISKSAA